MTPGAVGNPMVSFNLWALMEKRDRIQGVGPVSVSRETMERLISLAGEGKLKPVIDREPARARRRRTPRDRGA